MYNDDRVSPSKFTNMQKKHAVVLRCHMKTATILFYVSPSIKTRIKNMKTIDLMEVEKGHDQLVPSNGVEDSGDIDVDGQKGDADGYSGGSNLHMEEEDDNKDDEKEEGEVGKWTLQVVMSLQIQVTRPVEQGPRTPLERAAHE